MFLFIAIMMRSMSSRERKTFHAIDRSSEEMTDRSLFELEWLFFTSRDGEVVSTIVYLKCTREKSELYTANSALKDHRRYSIVSLEPSLVLRSHRVHRTCYECHVFCSLVARERMFSILGTCNRLHRRSDLRLDRRVRHPRSSWRSFCPDWVR